MNRFALRVIIRMLDVVIEQTMEYLSAKGKDVNVKAALRDLKNAKSLLSDVYDQDQAIDS